MKDDTESSRSGAAAAVVVLLLLFGVPLLLFLPLILSLVESVMFGTDHVYETCQALGIADALGAIYRPVVEFVDDLFS